MSVAYDQEWYDQAMTEEDAPAMVALEDSPWRTVYEQIASWIDPFEEVVDLGCGTGRFIEQLCRREHYAKITGVDWSGAAISEAQRYVDPREATVGWEIENLEHWEPDPERAGNTVFVSIETLEHLAFDEDLVRAVPPGHRFLFSVPNFDSESHVRKFVDVGTAFRRYASLLWFRRWVMTGTDRQGIHMYEAWRRGDSW